MGGSPRGEWGGGYRPHGYQVDRSSSYLTIVKDEAPVVRRIFRLYVRDRLGTRAIANALNADGHRTKAGNPWSGAAVLTVLRNRVYLGEVYYRGLWHKGDRHHPSIISSELFDQAQQILIARGDDHNHRVSASSNYLLAGVIFCQRCGKRYLGTSARGNRYTYRYYTCFSRQRYGADTCDAERLPADDVERGVLDSLLATLSSADIINTAIDGAYDEQTSQRTEHLDELAAIEREFAKTEAAIDRYLTAFENGTMPEDSCGSRVQQLATKANGLSARRDELGLLLDEPTAVVDKPAPDLLKALRDHIRSTLHVNDTDSLREVLQTFVHDVRVTGRHQVQPTFRLPIDNKALPAEAERASSEREASIQVCTLPGSVPPVGFEPTAPALGEGDASTLA